MTKWQRLMTKTLPGYMVYEESAGEKAMPYIFIIVIIVVICIGVMMAMGQKDNLYYEYTMADGTTGYAHKCQTANGNLLCEKAGWNGYRKVESFRRIDSNGD